MPESVALGPGAVRATLAVRVVVTVRDDFVGWLATPEPPLRCDDTEWRWERHTEWRWERRTRWRMRLSIALPGAEKRDCLLTGDALCSLVTALTSLV